LILGHASARKLPASGTKLSFRGICRVLISFGEKRDRTVLRVILEVEANGRGSKKRFLAVSYTNCPQI